MDQNTVNAIEKLATAVGKTGSDVVQYYATWNIVASIVWGILGALIVFVGFRIKGDDNDEFIGLPAIIVKSVVIGIGLLFLCDNIIDLLAPQGIAIHQLIKDLRG